VKCRFCDALAIARFGLDQGCACHPDDREQYLCAHHARRAQPLGDMELIEDFTRDGIAVAIVRGEACA
jgi:hypothetical protein